MLEKKQDTKAQIFFTALRLFAANGVENVSMRDIAKEVGIKAASIYNHYSGKDQLVEACYDFMTNHYEIGRPDKKEYELLLEKGSKEDVVSIVMNQYPVDLEEHLIHSLVILFSRMHTDKRAMEKYTELLKGSLQYLTEFARAGIELGRFDSFNVRGVSLVFLSVSLFIAQYRTTSADVYQDWDAARQEMVSELINLIPFNY